MNNKSKAVLDEMVIKGYIPIEGTFEVTDHLCQIYFCIYKNFFSKDPKNKLRKQDIIFSKKLAGLNMIKLNKLRTETNFKSVIKRDKLKINSGFVYVITNKAFEGKAKIGITKDVKSRLDSYQTYDPYRQFELKHYKFVENAKETENEILNKFSLDIDKGEWVSTHTVNELIEFLR